MEVNINGLSNVNDKNQIKMQKTEPENLNFNNACEQDLKNYSVVELNEYVSVTKNPFPTHNINEKTDIPLCAQKFSDLTDPICIKTICLEKVPEWVILNKEDLCVSQVLAGLTSQLFVIYIKDESVKKYSNLRKKVFFRIYSKDIRMLYNPEFELEVFKFMSKHHVAPLLLNTFNGGRIEEWLDGDPLRVDDLNNPAILAAIANLVGKYHTLSHKYKLPSSWGKTPCIYDRLEKWINEVININEFDNIDIDINKYIDESFKYMKFLKEYTKSDNPANDIIFCHNDLQENNIISTRNCLRLIDFEYSNYNYLAYDTASLFTEAMIDYTVTTHPFYSIDRKKNICYELKKLYASVYLSVYLNKSTLPSNEKLIKPFLEAVDVQCLASHLLWGFWSLIRAHQTKSYNDFDFVLYAIDRFEMYDYEKKQLMEKNIINY